MKSVKILGMGCPKCKALAEAVEKAAKELNIECNIEKVTDLNKISQYGVLATPALVVDEKVVSAGKVLSVDEVKKFLS